MTACPVFFPRTNMRALRSFGVPRSGTGDLNALSMAQVAQLRHINVISSIRCNEGGCSEPVDDVRARGSANPFSGSCMSPLVTMSSSPSRACCSAGTCGFLRPHRGAGQATRHLVSTRKAVTSACVGPARSNEGVPFQFAQQFAQALLSAPGNDLLKDHS